MSDLLSIPHVHVVVLGGTMTMSAQPGGGIAPTLSGDDLLADVPSIRRSARLSVETPFLVPGASLSFAHLRTVSERVSLALAQGARGVVVVQGTDTIEETAFLLDLAHGHDRPVVITGAMRGAEAPGADGPANLLAAVLVAGSERAGGLGLSSCSVTRSTLRATWPSPTPHCRPPSLRRGPARSGTLRRVCRESA